MAAPVPRADGGAATAAGPDRPVDPQAAARLVEEVAGLLADLHAGTARPVHLDSDLTADLGLDSLAVVELHDRLEHAFGVTLPVEVMSSAATPADWLRAVMAARTATTPAGRPAAPRHLAAARPGGEPWPADAPTLVDALEWHVANHPDLVTVVLLGTSPGDPAEELTYRALADGARAVAAGLAGEGLARGERVAIMLPTGREYFCVFLGVLLAGGVPVPIYPPARLSVVEEHLGRQSRLLDNAGAALLVTVPEAILAARLIRPHVPSLRGVRTPAALAAGGRGGSPLPLPRTGDVALIQYTSGSTGDPKGVVLTHAQLLANIAAMGRAAEVSTADVFVSWLPLYHDMGLIGAWLAPLFFGMRLVVMSPLTFLARPASWLEAITAYMGTLSAAPNFAFLSCAERVAEADLASLDLSSWRLAFNGSETVSPVAVDRFVARFGPCGFSPRAMCPAYGLAEVGVGAAFSPLGRGPRVDTIARSPLERSGRAVTADPGDRGTTAVVGCGRPLPGYEIQVVGGDGEVFPERREGSVECRGPSATDGYFANEVANRSLWRGGWLVTGDLGYLADGELFLTGRAKDLVIRGGRNLHPEALEQALGELAGVRRDGVAVFASADPRRGTERLVVVAETDLEAPDDRAALEARITKEAVEVVGAPPDEVVLTRPGALVRTASGKLRRGATRDAFEFGVLGRRPAPVAVQLARFGFSGLGSTARRAGRAVAAWGVGAYLWGLVAVVALPLWAVFLLAWPVRARWALSRAAGRAYCAMAGIAVTVEGALPPAGRAVVVANHPSFVDGLVLVLASPSPLAFVTSTDMARHRMVGGFLRRLGCAFVERGQPEGSAGAVAGLASLAERGDRLAVFPEGSISPTPGLRPFHLGAFATAAAAGCPVVPVGIRGTRQVVRPGTYLPRRADVSVRIGAPIAPQGSGFLAQVALRDAVRAAVAELSGEADAG